MGQVVFGEKNRKLIHLFQFIFGEEHDGSTTKPVDFCTQHSLADFRVHFNGFRWEFMEMKEKLDTFAPFDVCRSPSLRLNTMIPSILQHRYHYKLSNPLYIDKHTGQAQQAQQA